MTVLSLDYETKCELDLKKVGLDRYSADPSVEVLMCSYSFDYEQSKLWQRLDGPFPSFLKEALQDPHVEKHAFNAQFERIISRRALKLKTDYISWRCTMARAYMLSFIGALDEVGEQIDLPFEKQKLKDGKRLIKIFCSPQRVTKKNPLRWRDELTDPEEWEKFCNYCLTDNVAEMAIDKRLSKYEVPDFEWEVYHLDQRINDRGLPIDVEFVRNAIEMSDRRKAELMAQMQELTNLDNPNSGTQLLPWLQERGYRYGDLQKNTIKKVIREDELEVTSECFRILKLRQQSARTSVKKYDRIMELLGAGDRIRFAYQYGGASRTLRFAGRGIQPQNLPSTPKAVEIVDGDVSKLKMLTDSIREGDYDLVGLIMEEPLDALSGCVRSSIAALDGQELRVNDLASIESVVIGWLTGCERLLNVFRSGKCAYKDFATILFKKLYEEITKEERKKAKPAVLGCGFRLSGGFIDYEGKKTGLAGYAENMGVEMTLEEAAQAVKVFRETYKEIVHFWYDIESTVKKCLQSGQPQQLGPLLFELNKPFMTVRLPSGRKMYYYKPRINLVTFPKKDKKGRDRYDEETGELLTYTKWVFSYEGKEQDGHGWYRMDSHGGKLIENFVQAIARDILCIGMVRAHKKGFNLVLHTHDEILALEQITNQIHTQKLLRELMVAPIDWCLDMPLNAAGWSNKFYFKD